MQSFFSRKATVKENGPGAPLGEQLQRSPSGAKSAFGPVTPEIGIAALIGRNVRCFARVNIAEYLGDGSDVARGR
jgi:hypothetical protein